MPDAIHSLFRLSIFFDIGVFGEKRIFSVIIYKAFFYYHLALVFYDFKLISFRHCDK